MAPPTVYVGCGAGFSGDRLDAAIPVVNTLTKKKGPKYLIFETLAERTLALAQKHKQKDPSHGYSPFLEDYLRPILKTCADSGIKIVSNFGAANPIGAAKKISEIATQLECKSLRIAIILGDDLLNVFSDYEIRDHPVIEGLEISD